MSRTCGVCNGRGYFGRLGQYPCRVCGGSGNDPNWSEKRCLHCGAWIEYNLNWEHPSQYCESCRQPQYKFCENPDCGGQVEYKLYWDNIPRYCKNCRGWREKPCKNPDCSGKVKFHNDWSNVHGYCDYCKGWRTKPCKVCSKDIKYHNDWDHPPSVCGECTAMSRRRGISEICRGTELEKWLPGRGYNIRDERDSWHVTIYVDGGHVSGNVDKFSTNVTGLHVRIHPYTEEGKRVKDNNDEVRIDL